MAVLEHLYAIVCPSPECGEHIVLPHGTLPGISETEWYWPTNEPTLALVCPCCRRLSVHPKPTDPVRMLEEDSSQSRHLFWRVSFACDQDSCDRYLVVHTTTQANASPADALVQVLSATPRINCGNGHAMDADQLFSIGVVDFPQLG